MVDGDPQKSEKVRICYGEGNAHTNGPFTECSDPIDEDSTKGSNPTPPPPPERAPPEDPEDIDYAVIFTFGDSYSAGNGGGDYYGKKGCWRSANNYAWRFARQFKARFPNVRGENNVHACHGAVAGSLSGQIDAVDQGDLSEANYVFLTAGGNDFKFSTIVAACMLDIPEALRELVGKAGDCADIMDAQLTDSKLDGVIGKLESAINKLRIAAPRAHIVLIGYPKLTDPTCSKPSAALQRKLANFQSKADSAQRQMMRQIDRVDGANRLHFLSVISEFEGLGPCGKPSERYVFNKRWPSRPILPAEALVNGPKWVAETFHPNKRGYNSVGDMLIDLLI